METGCGAQEVSKCVTPSLRRGSRAHMMATRCVLCAKYIKLMQVSIWPVMPLQASPICGRRSISSAWLLFRSRERRRRGPERRGGTHEVPQVGPQGVVQRIARLVGRQELFRGARSATRLSHDAEEEEKGRAHLSRTRRPEPSSPSRRPPPSRPVPPLLAHRLVPPHP